MKRFEVDCVFDPRDVLRLKAEKGVVLSETVAEELKTLFRSVALRRENFNVLSFDCEGEGDPGEAARKLKESLTARCGVKDPSITVREGTESTPAEKTKAPASPAPSAPAPDPSDWRGPYDRIRSLVGMDAVKAWADAMKGMAERFSGKESPLPGMLTRISYLISVNPGSGCTTATRLMGEMLLPLVRPVKKKLVFREDLLDPDPEKGNLGRIEGEIEDLEENEKLYVYVLHLDKLLDRLKSERWQSFLHGCLKSNHAAVFFFAVPVLESGRLLEIHASINDQLSCRILKINPYSNEDYLTFCEQYLSSYRVRISTDAHDLFLKKIAEEKSDGRFYGVNTVRKICDEILYYKLENAAAGADMDSITPADVSAVLTDTVGLPGNLSGWESLDQLVALGEVKRRVREITALIRLHHRNGGKDAPAMHMIFSGAPGTGKTAVARVIGKILKEEGVLAKGDFYEVSRKDLVGRYVGHTAPKTAEVCRAAYGSVLFIDEAYLLDGGSDNDYGKEAIGTLIAEMENNRDRLVVIFAGYSKELERLFELNPGLRDRIPYHLNFPNYSREELSEIFFVLLGDRYPVGEGFRERVEAYFAGLPDPVLKDENFSNARFVRNLLERVISKAAFRLQMEEAPPEGVCLTVSDFDYAVSDAEFRKLNRKTVSRPVGF